MSPAGATGFPLVRGEVHTGLAGLMHLREDWARLIERGATGGFAVTHSCYEALLRYRHPDPARVKFFCLRGEQGEPLAICPLETAIRKIRRLPFSTWQFPPDPDRPASGFVIDPRVAPAELLPALVPMLKKIAPGVGLLALERVEEGSGTWNAAGDSSYATHASRQATLLRISADHSADEILARTSSMFRRNIRRASRRLSRAGEVCYSVARTGVELERALAAFLELEAAGWKGREGEGNAILKRPAVARHARGVVGLLGARDECEIHCFWQGARCLAALVCFSGGGELFAFKIARDEEFATFSLGHLMIHRVIDACATREEIRRINFGWETEWMAPWGGETNNLWEIHVALGAFPGRLAIGLLGGNQGTRKWIAKAGSPTS